MFGHDWVKHDGKIIERRLKHATDTTAVHEYMLNVRPAGQPEAEPLMRVLVPEPEALCSSRPPTRASGN